MYKETDEIKNKILLKEYDALFAWQKPFSKLSILSLGEYKPKYLSNVPIIKLPYESKIPLYTYFFRFIFILALGIILYFIIIGSIFENVIWLVLLFLSSPVLIGWYYLLFYLQSKATVYIDEQKIKTKESVYPLDDIYRVFVLIRTFRNSNKNIKCVIVYFKDQPWLKLYFGLGTTNTDNLPFLFKQLLKDKSTSL